MKKRKPFDDDNYAHIAKRIAMGCEVSIGGESVLLATALALKEMNKYFYVNKWLGGKIIHLNHIDTWTHSLSLLQRGLAEGLSFRQIFSYCLALVIEKNTWKSELTGGEIIGDSGSVRGLDEKLDEWLKSIGE